LSGSVSDEDRKINNVDNWWPAVDAFTFEFFRDMYEELDR
jgi:hypothetical protein